MNLFQKNSAVIFFSFFFGISVAQKTNPDSLAIGTADEHQEMMDILFEQS